MAVCCLHVSFEALVVILKTCPKSSCSGQGDFDGIPGALAHECLRSMPFRPDLGLQFLDQYMGYLQFHSTIKTLQST